MWPHEFADLAEAEKIIRAAFDDYNNDRIHSSLGYLTPAEFAELWWQWMDGEDCSEHKQVIRGDRCA